MTLGEYGKARSVLSREQSDVLNQVYSTLRPLPKIWSSGKGRETIMETAPHVLFTAQLSEFPPPVGKFLNLQGKGS